MSLQAMYTCTEMSLTLTWLFRKGKPRVYERVLSRSSRLSLTPFGILCTIYVPTYLLPYLSLDWSRQT